MHIVLVVKKSSKIEILNLKTTRKMKMLLYVKRTMEVNLNVVGKIL